MKIIFHGKMSRKMRSIKERVESNAESNSECRVQNEE
jgi:hypothetical protein